MDARDVLVVQAGEELGFTLEASHPFRVGADGLWEDFDGDLAIEAGIDRPIHLAHAPGAE